MAPQAVQRQSAEDTKSTTIAAGRLLLALVPALLMLLSLCSPSAADAGVDPSLQGGGGTPLGGKGDPLASLTGVSIPQPSAWELVASELSIDLAAEEEEASRKRKADADAASRRQPGGNEPHSDDYNEGQAANGVQALGGKPSNVSMASASWRRMLTRRSRGFEAKRKLDDFTVTALGMSVSFGTGATMAAINASYHRYDSVVADRTGVDWRRTPYVTPVQVQMDCASCWAMAAADTVAMATAIATKSPAVVASTQQICDCAGKGCCEGGWPEDAFAYMTSQGNVTANSEYNYWAQDGMQCAANYSADVAGKISGWERVPALNQDALMKAVSMQPVLVFISASSPDFQSYVSASPNDTMGDGVTVYDGDCTTAVDHALVVVGYNIPGGYWILKNTWSPELWGDNGYMYIKMLDGPGKCGMMTVSPIYPVYFPGALRLVTVDPSTGLPILQNSAATNSPPAVDPCSSVINPCGSGTCTAVAGIARCLCPTGFVEVVGAPTSKCVTATPCSDSLINPCGTGQCMNVLDGSYLCGCPTGYSIGYRTDGAPTCVPANALLARTYLAQLGDTCQRLRSLFNIPSATFSSLNPYLDCSNPIVSGILVTIPPSSGVACAYTYSIRQSDTCDLLALHLNMGHLPQWLMSQYKLYQKIATKPTAVQYPRLTTVPSLANVPPAFLNAPQDQTLLMSLNPALNCSAPLVLGRQICVGRSADVSANISSNVSSSNSSAIAPACTVTYTTANGDTCLTLMSAYNLTFPALLSLNPGLNCVYRGGNLTAGIQLCVAAGVQQNQAPIPCTTFYQVQQGDSCARIWNAANLSQAQFLYINPGLQCQTPYLYTGQQLCIQSPALANISDPSFMTYTVKPGDTWQLIQSQFISQCSPWSVDITRIAQQNGVADWVANPPSVNSTLVIPCVPNIGQSDTCTDCGSDTSGPVCGADFVTYPSACLASCNYAEPYSWGPCDPCDSACMGRYGKDPSPKYVCPAQYSCPFPQWPSPSYPKRYPNHPRCSYRADSCTHLCKLLGKKFGTQAIGDCHNHCMACSLVPCWGPSISSPPGNSDCPSCTALGCKQGSAGMCIIDCAWWNKAWGPGNPQ